MDKNDLYSTIYSFFVYSRITTDLYAHKWELVLLCLRMLMSACHAMCDTNNLNRAFAFDSLSQAPRLQWSGLAYRLRVRCVSFRKS